MGFRTRKFLLVLTILIAATALLPACSGAESHLYEMAPVNSLPAELLSAPISVQESYRFAISNPDTLKQIPCYCGCGSIGHTSNYMCYVQQANSDGSVVVDDHALGCSICVDITQDAMRLLDEGKSVSEIRAYADSTYSKYGPSNMP